MSAQGRSRSSASPKTVSAAPPPFNISVDQQARHLCVDQPLPQKPCHLIRLNLMGIAERNISDLRGADPALQAPMRVAAEPEVWGVGADPSFQI